MSQAIDAGDWVREHYAPLRNAPKLLHRITGSAPRTAGKWLRGEGDPSLGAFLEICRHNPDIRARLFAALEGK